MSCTLTFCFVVLVFTQCLVKGQLCPGETAFTFNAGSCLSLASSSLSRNFDQARSACAASNSADLVNVSSQGELSALQSYARSLGRLGTPSPYWVGYRYSGSDLQDVDGGSAPMFVSDAVFNNSISAGNGVCVAIRQDGTLINAQCTDQLMGYFCQFTLTNPTVSSVQVNGTIINPAQPLTLSLGLMLTISCDFTDTTSSSIVQWTLNGYPVAAGLFTTSADRSTTQLSLSPLLNEGIYQCQVNNSDGRYAEERIRIYGSLEVLFPPGPLSTSGFIASANTNTSLLIEWFPPVQSFVPNPLLLQYTLYYSTDSTIDTSSDPSVSGLTTGTNGMGSYELTSLSVGTVYFLTMRASNAAGLGSELESVAVATTFGVAPRGPPLNLRLSRNQANNALLAEWEAVPTELPIGDIVFHEVNFRNFESSVINTLFIGSQFNLASIFNISNAQSYEVRVRAAVQSTRDPVTYTFSPFTDWVAVSGIAPTIPSVPTIAPVNDRTLAITLGVVVPIVFAIVAVAIVSVIVLVACVSRSPGNEYIDGSSRRRGGKVSPPKEASPPPQTAVDEPDEKEQIL